MGRLGSDVGAILDGDLGSFADVIFLVTDLLEAANEPPEEDFVPLIDARFVGLSSAEGEAGLFPPNFPPTAAVLFADVGREGRFCVVPPLILSENIFLHVQFRKKLRREMRQKQY